MLEHSSMASRWRSSSHTWFFLESDYAVVIGSNKISSTMRGCFWDVYDDIQQLIRHFVNVLVNRIGGNRESIIIAHEQAARARTREAQHQVNNYLEHLGHLI